MVLPRPALLLNAQPHRLLQVVMHVQYFKSIVVMHGQSSHRHAWSSVSTVVMHVQYCHRHALSVL